MKSLKLFLSSVAVVSALVFSGCWDPGTIVDPLSNGTIVKVSAEWTSLRVNESTQLAVQGETVQGQPVELGTVTFSTGDKTIAEVDPGTGFVTARGTGTTVLTASSAKGKGTLTLKVEGGAIHKSVVSQSETWYAKDSPHYVQDTVKVEGPSHPVLTIEPGAIVRFAAQTGLSIGVDGPGSLRAEGTADRIIQFLANSELPSPGFWRSIDFGFQSGLDSKLTYSQLSHCGNTIQGDQRAPCIFIAGDGSGNGARPVLADVTIAQGARVGVSVGSGGGFGSGSARVSVVNGRSFPFSVEADAVGTLPRGGMLTDNTNNLVEVSGGMVLESQTWPDLGVPYLISSDVKVAGPGSPVLTLEAGVTLRLEAGVAFKVGEEHPGALQAVGTEQKPITFTAHSAVPEPGFWTGLFFYPQALRTSRLTHAVVEYAGGYNGLHYKGNVMILADRGPIVTSSQLRHSGQCGIVRYQWDDLAFSTDFTDAALGNTFQDIPGSAQCGPE
jgi:hypothetical protein